MVYSMVGVWRCLKLVNLIRPTLSAFSNCLFGFLGRKQLFKMKKYLFALLVCVMAFAGCSKDDETPKFNYDLETLYGTWRVTEVQQKTVVSSM